LLEIIPLVLLFALGVPLATVAIGVWSQRPAKPQEAAPARDSHGRAAVIACLLWAVLTALGVWFSLAVDYYPIILSDKAEEIADAFRVLMVLSAPVAALVVAVLAYTMIRRGYDEVPADGPPIQGRGTAPLVWFGVTTALTALVIVYPGLTSLHSVIKSEENPDLVVQVEGLQWTWLVTYPELGVANAREIMLPVDRTVRFEITSRDVLHSFWVPAFLMKVDAVPGLTTTMSLRPTAIASYDLNPTVRLQCAELCGTSHGAMQIPVAVVSQADFDAWVAEHASTAPAGSDQTSLEPAGASAD
jgi:cytochrome c oxidase subunit 2